MSTIELAVPSHLTLTADARWPFTRGGGDAVVSAIGTKRRAGDFFSRPNPSMTVAPRVNTHTRLEYTTMSRILTIILTLCFVLAGTTTFADSDRLGLKLRNKVSGKNLPALMLSPTEDVKSVSVKLRRNDGKKLSVSATNIKAGSEKLLEIKQEHGKFNYDAVFNVAWAGGEKSKFTMRFAMERTKQLELQLDPADVDLDARKMTFSITNDAKKAVLIFYDDAGDELDVFCKKYKGAKAGTTLALKWADAGDFAYMDLRVYDTDGFWTGVRLTPFSIAVPHERIVFDSGKWNIKKSEEPKLDKALKHIKQEMKKLAKHNAKLPLRFYIAGYTDTVGAKASNRTLSNNRARSIAAWFRKNGLSIPTFYQGFGEDALAVDTPDDTDEARNRRAIFILGTQQPSKSHDFPSDKWSKL